MANKTRLNRQNIMTWILNAIIIVLCFLFVISVSITVESLVGVFSMPANEDNFYYDIESENFYSIPYFYHMNVQAGFEGNDTMKEYYGVAKYYEAASLYKAYDAVGNTKQAQKYQNFMEQAATEMGSWSIAQKAIDAQLGIEE